MPQLNHLQLKRLSRFFPKLPILKKSSQLNSNSNPGNPSFSLNLNKRTQTQAAQAIWANLHPLPDSPCNR